MRLAVIQLPYRSASDFHKSQKHLNVIQTTEYDIIHTYGNNLPLSFYGPLWEWKSRFCLRTRVHIGVCIHAHNIHT